MLRTTHTVSAGPAGHIFARKGDGRLVGYRHTGFESGAATWARTTERIVRSGDGLPPVDWSSYRHLAVDHTPGEKVKLYAVGADGAVLLYRVDVRAATVGRPTTLTLGAHERLRWARRPGSGRPWLDYVHVTAGSDGAIYAVDDHGSLHHYRVVDDDSGTRLVSQEPTVLARGPGQGSGWDGYTQVSAGDDGALYAVRRDGSLVWFRHLGWADGTPTFASSVETVLVRGPGHGGGWDTFTHMFSGAKGALYGVKDEGSLVYYRHTGWESGRPQFATKAETVLTRGRGAGTGWDQFDRLSGVETVDGLAIVRRGTLRRVRRHGRSVTVDSDMAAVHASTPKYGVTRIMFQNMQLFPDTVDDVVDPRLRSAAEALGVATTAAVAGLVMPDPALVVAYLLAGEQIKELPTLTNAIRSGLGTTLYKGAGRGAQIDGLIDVLRRGIDDVVALCEMWVPDEARTVAEAVADRYPHWSYGPYNRPDFLPSGLMVLSKRPITRTDAIVFRASLGEDGLSSKGVMWARIDDAYDLFVTHLQSDNPKIDSFGFGPGATAFDKQALQAEAVRAFMDACHDPRLPAVLVGDFNLDAAAGRFVDWGADDADLQSPALLHRQAELLTKKLAHDDYHGTSRLRPFAEDVSPTDGLDYYRPNGSPLPKRSSGTAVEVWRKEIGLDHGKQIDNVFVVPGLHARWRTSGVARVEHYVDYGGTVGRRQLSDHIAVRLTTDASQAVTTELRRRPRSVTGRIAAIQCFLETDPHGSADQITARLTLHSGGESRTVKTGERDHHRFRRRHHHDSPSAELTELGDDVRIEVALREHDGFWGSDGAGIAAKEIPLSALLGTDPITTGRAEVTTSWWVGVLRGKGGEYAACVELTAVW